MKFIDFMKKYHAWTEFKNELLTQNELGDMATIINEVIKIADGSTGDAILDDGYYFFYADATRSIDWIKLNTLWIEHKGGK